MTVWKEKNWSREQFALKRGIQELGGDGKINQHDLQENKTKGQCSEFRFLALFLTQIY